MSEQDPTPANGRTSEETSEKTPENQSALYEQVIDLQRQVRRLRSLIIILFVGLTFIATGWTPLQMGPTTERSLVVYEPGGNSLMMEPTTGLRVFNHKTNQIATLVTDADGTRLMFANLTGGPAHQIGIDADGNLVQRSGVLPAISDSAPVPMLPASTPPATQPPATQPDAPEPTP